jgi:hypothetical protein
MAEDVSLLHVTVSFQAPVSLGGNTTAIAVIGVNVLGGVSLTGQTGAPPPPPPPPPPPGVGPAYQFNKASNSMYIPNVSL